MKLTDPSPLHSQLTGIVAADHHEIPIAHPGSISNTNWVLPGWSFGATAGNVVVADRRYYTPIYVANGMTYVRIGVHVRIAGAGGTVARLGLYAATITTNRRIIPGALVLDAGTVSVATTGGKEITIDETLPSGFYFLALSSNGVPNLTRPATSGPGSMPIATLLATVDVIQGSILAVDGIAGEGALPDPATAPTFLIAYANAHGMLRY